MKPLVEEQRDDLLKQLLDAVQRVVELADAGEVYMPRQPEVLTHLCTAWQDFVEGE